MRTERLNLSEWAEALPGRGTELIHTRLVPDVISRHVPEKLQLIGGFKDDEPVGLFPNHEQRKLGGRLLTSPPLSKGIGRLGPIVMLNGPKQSKQEQTYRNFVRASLVEYKSKFGNSPQPYFIFEFDGLATTAAKVIHWIKAFGKRKGVTRDSYEPN